MSISVTSKRGGGSATLKRLRLLSLLRLNELLDGVMQIESVIASICNVGGKSLSNVILRDTGNFVDYAESSTEAFLELESLRLMEDSVPVVGSLNLTSSHLTIWMGEEGSTVKQTILTERLSIFGSGIMESFRSAFAYCALTVIALLDFEDIAHISGITYPLSVVN